MYDTKVIKQDTIYAANDTLAYIEADRLFTFSTKAYDKIKEKTEKQNLPILVDKPYNFMLFDSDNNIISNKIPKQ